jgi:hypothetical protein
MGKARYVQSLKITMIHMQATEVELTGYSKLYPFQSDSKVGCDIITQSELEVLWNSNKGCRGHKNACAISNSR